MKNGKPKSFTRFLWDCRRPGRQTVGSGIPFNPALFLSTP